MVFTIYWFIFYGILHYALGWWNPALLDPPERLSQTYLSTAVAIFTGLVILAYVGAAFVVLGRLPGSPTRSREFYDRDPGGPAPGDRLRASRRFFGRGAKSGVIDEPAPPRRSDRRDVPARRPDERGRRSGRRATRPGGGDDR